MSKSPERILVLGGYGHFGARICERLGRDSNLQIVVAGRELSRSRELSEKLAKRYPASAFVPIQLDHAAADFAQRLADVGAAVVIHTAGPFQGQDYHVAHACIHCGSHYVDLADGREFVARIRTLDDDARKANVLIVSGASTLPGLSTAVVNHLRSSIENMSGIDIGIVPGNHTPRGLGTIAAVLSYCGREFTWLESGRQVTVHGWQNLTRRNYPSLGTRLLGACDVPDLALLPEFYRGVGTVTFRAGMELRWQQWMLWFMASLHRIGLVGDWSAHAGLCKRISEATQSWGTDNGGMHVQAWGTSSEGKPLSVSWTLTARQNHGPEIPCIPAVVLAKKLANGQLAARGAFPCLGLMTLEEFSNEIADLDISWTISEETE